MADAEFEALVGALTADLREGSTRRLPVITAAQGAAIARGLHAEVDGAHRDRAAHAAASGATIACARGCTACCQTVVVTYLPEAARVAAWLARPESTAARQAFVDAYPDWRARIGDGTDRLVDCERRGDLEAAQREFDDLRRRRVPCPFLRDGACSIYEVRPVVCRHTMALDTAEHCGPPTPGAARPRMLAFAPADQLVGHGTRLLRFAHRRMPGGSDPARPLADAVRDLLEVSPGI